MADINLNDISQNTEQGKLDSSVLIDLEELTLCDIPSYLSNIPDDEDMIDEDDIDDILADLEDTSALDDFIDNLLSDPLHPKYPATLDNSFGDNEDSSTNNGNEKSVIIDFAAETNLYPAEEFVWNVEPGDTINSDTIIAFCRQKNKMLPVKSIFSQGIVRKDSNNDYWRCWNTICSRHIVIDKAISDFSKTGTAGVDYSALYKDPSVFETVEENMQTAQDAFEIMTDFLPYTLYLNLIYYKSKKEYKTNSIIPPLYKRTEPEDVFTEFIKKYLDIQETYRNNLLKLYGGKNDVTKTILETKGNTSKIEDLGQQIIDLNRKYFFDIATYCMDTSVSFLEEVDIQQQNEQWTAFSKKLDFKMYPYKDDNEKGLTDLSDIGDDVSNFDYEKVDAAKAGQMFCDYFNHLNKMIYNNNRTLCKELKSILSKIVNEYNLPETDAEKENKEMVEDYRWLRLKNALETLTTFIKKCYDLYNQYSVSSVKFKIGDDSGGYLNQVLNSLFKEEAEWPLSVDYYYSPTHENFEHYIFPNIDAMYQTDDSSIDIDAEDEDFDPNAFKDVDGLTRAVEEQNNKDYNYDGNPSEDITNAIEIDHSKDAETIENDFGKLKYWRKYLLKMATICTCFFLCTGIPLPYHRAIKLPCIYIPFFVLKLDKIGLVIVFGIAIRGIAVNPLIIYVNVSMKQSSILIGVLMALNVIADLYEQKVQKSGDVTSKAANTEITKTKIDTTEELKSSKEIDAKTSWINTGKITGMQNFIDEQKKKRGLDTTQDVYSTKKNNLFYAEME